MWAYLSQTTVGFLLERSILGALRSSAARGRWWPLLVGSLLLVLLMAIPYPGVLATWGIVLLGPGSLAHWIQRGFHRAISAQPD